MARLNIGIAGAGIGGLAVSVALSQQGHRVRIYEAASELTEVDPFFLGPSHDEVLP